MTPLERAARAAMLHMSDEGGMPFEAGDDVPPAAYDIARAVLQAIREPSEAMISVAEDREKFGYDPLPSETFPAMIDAALEEG